MAMPCMFIHVIGQQETKKKAEQRQEEEQRQKEQDKQKAEEKQKKEEEEQEIFPLCSIKLGSAGSAAGGEGHGDGAQSLALPLLCADVSYFLPLCSQN